MTHPPANDHRSDEDHGNSVTSERPDLEEMITEAEALRANWPKPCSGPHACWPL